MSTVTCEFLGRLGNNLFQTAACIGYAKRYGVDWAIPRHYHHKGIYQYFNLPLYKGNPRKLPVYDVATDEGWGYAPIPKHDGDVKLRGFFQSEKNFYNAKDEVRQSFRLEPYPQYKDFVSIHVRRGDYVNNDSFPPVSIEYIKMAVDKMMSTSPFQNAVVFSDDIKWCRAVFIPYIFPGINFEFSPGKKEVSGGRNEFQQLSAMASCSNHIIANSSFSWWGAWLGHNPEKTIISPSNLVGNWFGNDKLDTTHLLPEEWIKIKFR